MAGTFHHEQLYRGADSLTKLAATRLTLCGAGALGSHLADNLARQGFTRLRVIDRDRVEGHNVGTQLYGEAEVGAWKVEVLRQRLFRAAGVEADAGRKELTERNARSLVQGAGLVLDTFDNSAARRPVRRLWRGSLGRGLPGAARRGRRRLRLPAGPQPGAAGRGGGVGSRGALRAGRRAAELVGYAG